MDINDHGLDTKLQEYMYLVHRNQPAVPVLRAMKLLTICGIPRLTGWRIRIVCDEILSEPSLVTERLPWEDALTELKRLEFVTVSSPANGDIALTICNDAYFERVVIDYPSDNLRATHRAKLLDVFTSDRDSDGLFYLGATLAARKALPRYASTERRAHGSRLASRRWASRTSAIGVKIG